jgi:hypothetical protein
MKLEVELVSAVLRTLPCIQVAILLGSGQEGVHEKAERSGGQAAGLHQEGGDAGGGDLKTEWVL